MVFNIAAASLIVQNNTGYTTNTEFALCITEIVVIALSFYSRNLFIVDLINLYNVIFSSFVIVYYAHCIPTDLVYTCIASTIIALNCVKPMYFISIGMAAKGTMDAPSTVDVPLIV
jgi:hypothetical protein